MLESSALTPALEDYLEAIYILQKVRDVVKVIDISEYLKVTMPSVTGGVRRLAALKYVNYEKRRHVRLTEEGERIARTVNRRHEELYSFYHDILGADRDTAQKSACRVEHVLDQSIIERIIRLTQWIQQLPDDTQLEFKQAVQIPEQEYSDKGSRTLNMVKPGSKAVVSRIRAGDEIGQRLLDMGITKGTKIEVVKVAPLGDPIDIKVKGYHLSLRKSEASNIEIEE